MTARSSGDPEALRDLFSTDATYGYRPWDSEQTTMTGADAIVAGWLENPERRLFVGASEHRPFGFVTT